MKCTKAATTWIVALTVVLGAASLGVRSAAGTSVAPWITFKSETEHLSVLMPGTPQAREKHNKSFVGDITTVEHSAKEGLDTYTVDYTTLPGFAISFSGTDGIYEHAKNAVLKDTISKPLSYTDITLNGIKGKKLVYDTPTKPGHPEMQGEAQFFLVGEHLYTIDAVVEMKGADKKPAHFFSSLEISKWWAVNVALKARVVGLSWSLANDNEMPPPENPGDEIEAEVRRVATLQHELWPVFKELGEYLKD